STEAPVFIEPVYTTDAPPPAVYVVPATSAAAADAGLAPVFAPVSYGASQSGVNLISAAGPRGIGMWVAAVAGACVGVFAVLV
ncbi:hypothetical protein HK101_005921, partial [Irineochytrium annulatum]